MQLRLKTCGGGGNRAIGDMQVPDWLILYRYNTCGLCNWNGLLKYLVGMEHAQNIDFRDLDTDNEENIELLGADENVWQYDL